MINHNFTLINVDTDSLTFCKQDMSEFSEDEKDNLIKEINSISLDGINWEDDGVYERVIVAKAKNYILYDGKKIKIKGSAFKSSTKSIALKNFMNDIIEAMLKDQTNYADIYHKYVQMIYSIKTTEEIQLWATKKTLTDKVLESDRTNEAKVRDAIVGQEFQEGDKFYVFYKSDDSLSITGNFDGDYNKKRLLKNLFDTTKTFATIIKEENVFINYSLKKNMKLAEEIYD